jgi:hypothetical protein
MKFAALSLLFAAVATTAFAAPPPGLRDVRQALTHSVQTKNWRGLADLISWPLPIDNYGTAPRLTKAQYLKDRRRLSIFLAESLLPCIAAEPATYQGNRKEFGFGSWVIDCTGNEFYFGQKNGKWLFTAYQNINE